MRCVTVKRSLAWALSNVHVDCSSIVNENNTAANAENKIVFFIVVFGFKDLYYDSQFFNNFKNSFCMVMVS